MNTKKYKMTLTMQFSCLWCSDSIVIMNVYTS